MAAEFIVGFDAILACITAGYLGKVLWIRPVDNALSVNRLEKRSLLNQNVRRRSH